MQKFLITATINGFVFDADLYVSIGDTWAADPGNGIMSSGFSFADDVEAYINMPDGSLHKMRREWAEMAFKQNEHRLYKEMDKRFEIMGWND